MKPKNYWCKQYIEFFGETTEEQKKIIKATHGYKKCELADAIEDMKKAIWEELKAIFRTIFRINKTGNIERRSKP